MTKTPLSLLLSAFVALQPHSLWAKDSTSDADRQKAVAAFTEKTSNGLKTLETPLTGLRGLSYKKIEHEKAVQALADLTTLLSPIKEKLPKLQDALTAASAQEKEFWTSFPEGANGRELEYGKAAGALESQLKLVVEGFGLLSGKPASELKTRQDPKMTQRGAELDGLRKEFSAVNGDLGGLEKILSGVYKERAKGSPGSDVVIGSGEGKTSRELAATAPAKREGFLAGDPGLPEAALVSGSLESALKKTDARISALRGGEAAINAVSPMMPISSLNQMTRAGLSTSWREKYLLESTAAGALWIDGNRDGLKSQGLSPDALKDEIDAIMALPAGEKEKRLTAWNARLHAAMDRSPTGLADADIRRLLSSKDPKDQERAVSEISRLQAADPAYFAARGLWAEYVTFNRVNFAQFPDGAVFSPRELGLPGDSRVVKTTRRGEAGYEVAGAGGAKRFISWDGAVTADEQTIAGKTLTVENRFKDGKLIVTTFDGAGKRLGAVVYEPAGSGIFVMYPEDQKWPRATGRFENNGFTAHKIENKDGTSQETAGASAPGVWVHKKNGAPLGWSWDAKTLQAMKNPEERIQAADQMARWVVAQGFAATGNNAQDRYRADSISALFKDMFKFESQGKVQAFFDRNEAKLVVNEFHQSGVRQLVAKFEPTASGKGVRGLKDEGLMVYVRNAQSLDDNSQFLRPYQYLGANAMESLGSDTRIRGSFAAFFAGPKVTSVPVITRRLRISDGHGGSSWTKGEVTIREDQIQTLFDGPGVIGATGQAVGTMGRGVVDLTGSGMAVVLAGGSKVFGADDAASDFMDRAKVNFFNNAVSAELGQNFGGENYRLGIETLKLDKTKYIQNAGREIADGGHPVLGAFVGAGVEFANNTVIMIPTIKGMQAVAGLGNGGRLAMAGVGVVMSGKTGWDTGNAINDFAAASKRFDEKDPASQQEYYARLQSLISHSANTALVLASVKEVIAARRGIAPTVKSVPIADPNIEFSISNMVPKSLRTRLAAFDAKIPGALEAAPGGGWLNRELAMTPAAVKASENKPAAKPVEKPKTPPPESKDSKFMTSQETNLLVSEKASLAQKRLAAISETLQKKGLPPLTAEQQQDIFLTRLYREINSKKGVAGRSKGKGGIVVLDNDAALGQIPLERTKGIIIDHHGRHFDPKNPEVDATMKFLDTMETALKGPGTMAEKIARFKQDNAIHSTNNLGDGAWSAWIAKNAERVMLDPALRAKIRLATEFEDFGFFGGKAYALAKTNPALAEAVELQQAVFKLYDQALARSGVKGSDRFDSLPAPQQRILMDEVMQGMTRVLDDVAFRQTSAKAFAADIEAAKAQVQAARTGLTPEAKAQLAAEGVDAKLLDDMFIYNSDKIQGGGTFANWGGPAVAHESGLQMNFKSLPGDRTQFILAVPNGKAAQNLKPLGEAIAKANAEKAAGMGLKPADAGAVMGRDALQFAFAPGLVLTPQEILMVMARATGKSVVAPAAAVPVVKTAPASPPAVDPVSSLASTVKSVTGGSAASGPEAFRTLILEVNKGLKTPQSESLVSARSAYKKSNAAEIVRLQEKFKSQLLSKSEEVAKLSGLNPSEVITHGTTMEGFMGMIMEGQIVATSRHAGMSGESANLWGSYGLKTGAQYGSTKGLSKGQPGVSILIHNKANPIKVIQGETLSRGPLASEDFVAAIITDGHQVVVLDQAAIRALSQSAQKWKTAVVGQAQKGNMQPFTEWEMIRDRFVPR